MFFLHFFYGANEGQAEWADGRCIKMKDVNSKSYDTKNGTLR